MAPDNRPSRLLNLSRSPSTNKAISSLNAANSPFLRLPPELRHRIYEYALGGQAIHVFSRLLARHKRDYSLGTCMSTSGAIHDGCQQRVCNATQCPELSISDFSLNFRGHKTSPHEQCLSAGLSYQLPLHILQTCRQIYGDAVLLPFHKNTFLASSDFRHRGLNAFLAALVPEQARSIARLSFEIDDDVLVGTTGVMKLVGLRSLHLIIPSYFYTHPHSVDTPPHTVEYCDLGALSQLQLKSVRITRIYPAFNFRRLTESIIEETEEHTKRQEEEILGSPDAWLARNKVEGEKHDRSHRERQAAVRKDRGLRTQPDPPRYN